MINIPSTLATVTALAAFTCAALADGPKDNLPAAVRPIPPPGVEIPVTDREALTKGVDELKQLIEEAKKAQAKNPQLGDLLPDVEIFHKSVDWALRYNFFNKVEETKAAYGQIAEGKKRAEALKAGTAPWTKQKGNVVRAYRSKIDGSVQPYGLSIPEGYNVDGGPQHRLDLNLHGRGEQLSELSFIEGRSGKGGAAPQGSTITLFAYGRYCCANKFAGEVDSFEALAHAKKFYRIDEDRTVVKGFSMGGAACWQYATHFSDVWCAAQPGAGFADTVEFLNVFQAEDVSKFPWYQRKLWQWYDSCDYAINLFNLPTVAYSGEIDKQKQAADLMAREMKKEGLELEHIIGPQTAHKIHPDSAIEIEKRLKAITAVGRNRTPEEVLFTTWTLRYNKMHWLTVDAMGEHWERARLNAKIVKNADIYVTPENVTAFTLDFDAGHCPLSPLLQPTVTISGQPIRASKPKSDRSWQAHFVLKDGKWTEGAAPEGLAKRHGLSGPIDDAFMDAFLFVTPTGPALNPTVEKWVTSELQHGVVEWQKQFRGDAPQKKDTEITEADIANNNLVLWGDPSSNAVLKKIADKLPVKWTAEGIEVGPDKYAAGEHIPVLVFPNPLNPNRYVVVNSSFTYREYDYLNNARQVAKLPDWAVINLSEAPNAVSPGKVAKAGFFDEQWKYKAPKAE